jgi:L-amino acid N-acyltransferase YncA
MKSSLQVRLLGPDDIGQLHSIYAHYVSQTAITFETDVPEQRSFAERLNGAHVCIYALVDDQVVGFAYAGKHRAKQAYDTVCESTIYMNQGYTGKGYGLALYRTLIKLLKHLGFHTVLGGITLPNPASAALHRRCGFELFCTYENIGFKQGAWHTVDWWRKDLKSFDDNARPVLSSSDIDEEILATLLSQ